jgi:hypothetical protein
VNLSLHPERFIGSDFFPGCSLFFYNSFNLLKSYRNPNSRYEVHMEELESGEFWLINSSDFDFSLLDSEVRVN